MSDDMRTEDTAEIPFPAPPSRPLWPETGSARVQIDLAALSHPGLVREHNEDHFLAVRVGRWLETLLTNLPADQLPTRAEEVGYGLVIADGVGGAAGGEVASRTAIRTLISHVLHTPDWIFSNEGPEWSQMMQRMADRFRRIDATLYEQGHRDPNLWGMGTTMTLTCSLGSSLIIGHIGDSRAYLFRGGELHQLTRDHTLVQALVDAGRLTAEEAAKHPFRHVLTRSLGTGEIRVASEFQQAWLADGDQLLLCTDGLTDMVDNATIGSILRGAATSDEACHTLVATALANGGKDNVTVALARYRFPQ